MAYAWSRFALEINEWGQVTKWCEVGEKISRSDIGVSDEEWKQLYSVGAVRDEPYPDIPSHMSPAEYWRANPDKAPNAKNKAAAVQEAPTLKVEKPTGIPGVTAPKEEKK